MNKRCNRLWKAIQTCAAGLRIVLALFCAPWAVQAQTVAKDSGGKAASTLLTIEGNVEVAANGGGKWVAAEPNQVLNPKDRVRTGEKSRATIRLSDFSVLRVNELTTLEIRPASEGEAKPLLDLKSGSSYFFNRDKPSNVRFRTPTVAGAIRGTEFLLAVTENGRTELSLFEGAVDLQNEQGTLSLASNEKAVVDPGTAPTRTAFVNAENLLQWVLYYPAVLDVNELELGSSDKEAIASSLDAYSKGDLPRALVSYPGNRQPGTDAEKVYRAALVLSVGQVAQSEQLLHSLTSSFPAGAALQRMIAAVHKRTMAAPPSTNSPSEWLAESYYQQSRGDLTGALDAARKATQLSPGFGYAWAKVAELEFGFGRVTEANTALAKALDLAPRNAQAVALQGFIFAAKNKNKEALKAFDQAIQLDGALGNAWLGRGLVQIRQGQAAAGRADLQVATTLEPQRAFLRSYLGKAFSNVGDNKHAEKEFNLAKELDPNDPTAWLYSALLLQRENRLNESVGDLERSKELNDNRSVFRSRQLLDQDRAVRSANLAAIYRDVGMFDVGLREASKAVNSDYGNYSAHLFLAESYDALRDPRQVNLRYETPWLSELLVANLLAPANAGIFSQNVSQQEYSRLFERDHFGVSSYTEYLSRGAWQQAASQYGVMGNSSYALDAYYQSDRGERRNNDIEQLSLSAKFKQQLTPQDSVYLQAVYYNAEAGDVAQYYNQASASLNQRIKEKQEPNLFAGYHHEWQPGVHTLVLAGRLVDDFEFSGSSRIFNLFRDPQGNVTGGFRFPYGVDYKSDFEAYSAEVQQIWQQQAHTVIAGGRFQTGENDVSVNRPLTQTANTDLRRYNFYGYYYYQVFEPLKLMAGVSYDNLNFPQNTDLPPVSNNQISKDKVSPKVGAYYTPFTDTTFRGAYTRSLGGLYYDNSVRLEPTQIAGFSQAFRSVIPESVVGLVPGSEFETYSVAFDQKLKTRTYFSASAEWINSKADRAVGVFNLGIPTTPGTIQERLDYRERTLYFDLHQLLGRDWALGAAYRNTHAQLSDHFVGLSPGLAGSANHDWNATLHQGIFYANYNLPCGFFAQGNAIWSQQSNQGYSPDIPGDNFWHFNIYAGYRFLQRRGEVRIGLLNLSDQDYQLNPLTLYSELPRHRTLAASLKLNF